MLRDKLHQLVGVAVVAAVTVMGALWYWLVEGFSLVDGVYQSIITVSTVGFGEVEELDASGRLFTSVLIVVGVSAVVFALGAFAEMIIDSAMGRVVSRRKERTLENLSNHTVLCGYGRTGEAVARMLPNHDLVGVIESDAEQLQRAADDGYVTVHGDCSLDETLQAAGIERATRLILCLSSDSDAISAALSARGLNADLLIVSRVNIASSTHKLRLAGVDHVVSPIEMGAQRMVADAMLTR